MPAPASLPTMLSALLTRPFTTGTPESGAAIPGDRRRPWSRRCAWSRRRPSFRRHFWYRWYARHRGYAGHRALAGCRTAVVIVGFTPAVLAAALLTPPPGAAAGPALRPAAMPPAAVRPAAVVPGTVVPAAAPSETSIEVNPSTVEAGGQVGLRASCPDNGKPATVRSDAFGKVTIKPQSGFLVGTVTIPKTQDPRSFTVRLTCSGGETATATLHVVARTRPTKGPATGFGGTAGGDSGGGLLIGGGLLAIAAGVVMGVLALRRRGLPG